jgi:hypothetical protein
MSYLVLLIGLYLVSQNQELNNPFFLTGLGFIAMALHEIID